MGAFRAWCRKELREQRWTLLVLVILVAAGTAVPFLLFAAETTPRTLHPFPGYAIGLAGLLVGGASFARDLRGPHALLLRTPGALRHALPAKFVVLALACLLAVAVEEAVRHALGTALDLPRTVREYRRWDGEVYRRESLPTTPLEIYGIPVPWASALIASGACAWLALGAVLLPQRGLGAAVGLATLGLAVAPLLALRARHPGWFGFPPAFAVTAMTVLAGVGASAATTAWRRGRGSLASTRRAVASGLTVVGIAATLAATGAYAAIDRWSELDPHDAHLVIQRGQIGDGGELAYLTVSRGPMRSGHGLVDVEKTLPDQAWIVRLTDGVVLDKARESVFLGRTPLTNDAWIATQPWIVRMPATDDVTKRRRGNLTTWIRGGEVHGAFEVTEYAVTSNVVEAARVAARRQAPFVDRRRRLTWVLGDHVEFDGPEGTRDVVADRVRRWQPLVHALTAGVFRVTDRPGGPATFVGGSVEAEGTWIDAKELAYEGPDDAGSTAWTTIQVGPTEAIGTLPTPLDAPPIWVRVAMERSPDGRVFAKSITPLPVLLAVEPVASDRLLVEVLYDRGSRLEMWTPSTYATNPRATVPADLGTGWLCGIVGRVDRDRVLVEIGAGPARAWEHRRSRIALLDLRGTPRLTALTPITADRVQPLTVEADGALVGIEEAARVVRWRDGGTKREVLFPRP